MLINDRYCRMYRHFWLKLPIFVRQSKGLKMTKKDINKLKVVLAEKKRTNKWLSEQLDKDPGTISKWCTNTSQPDLETLMKIARLLF